MFQSSKPLFQPCLFTIPIFTCQMGFLPCCYMSTEEIATVAITHKVWWTDVFFMSSLGGRVTTEITF